VIAPVVPDTQEMARNEDIGPVEAPLSSTAQTQLLRFVYGLPPEAPRGNLRLRDIIQRNAAEDMLLAASLSLRVPEMNTLAWSPFTFPGIGPEWYLRARDFVYRAGY
jgi:hypothetical protein